MVCNYIITRFVHFCLYKLVKFHINTVCLIFVFDFLRGEVREREGEADSFHLRLVEYESQHVGKVGRYWLSRLQCFSSTFCNSDGVLPFAGDIFQIRRLEKDTEAMIAPRWTAYPCWNLHISRSGNIWHCQNEQTWNVSKEDSIWKEPLSGIRLVPCSY